MSLTTEWIGNYIGIRHKLDGEGGSRGPPHVNDAGSPKNETEVGMTEGVERKEQGAGKAGLERAVSDHYGGEALAERILGALEEMGVSPDRVRPADLVPVEELHIGGREATEYLVEKLKLEPSHHLLDVGCGIGGTARHVVERYGCRVTGLDLTPGFVRTAHLLTRVVGFHRKAVFHVGSALSLPYEEAAFDAAVSVHVAMNIRDRGRLYREMGRVLRAGAPVGLFDVTTTGREGLNYPVPWAETPATSHLITPQEMVERLEAAGFEIEETEDRTAFAIDFFRRMFEQAPESPPPLGSHLVMEEGRRKLGNVLAALEQGAIVPFLVVARRR